jgi:hypothetical protein
LKRQGVSFHFPVPFSCTTGQRRPRTSSPKYTSKGARSCPCPRPNQAYSSKRAFSGNQSIPAATTVELAFPAAIGSGHFTFRFSGVAKRTSYSVSVRL